MKQIYFVTTLFACLQINAQKTGQPLVDSLIAALPSIKNDTVKARTYNRIFNELTFININEAMLYANKGLVFVTRIKWEKGVSVFQDNIAKAYSDQGNYDSAIFYFDKSLAINKKLGEKRNMASTYNNMGAMVQNIHSDYAAATDYYFKSFKLAEEVSDSTLMAVTLKNISVIYNLQDNFKKALEFAGKALLINQKMNNVNGVASSLENFGGVYAAGKKFKEAETFYSKALSLYEEAGNMEGVASALSALAIVYRIDYRKAIEVRIRARELWNQVNPFSIKSITNTGNIGIAYLDIARYDTLHTVRYGDIIPDNKDALLQKAESYLTEAVRFSEQIGEPDNKSYYMAALAELQEFKGDYKKAYYNFKAYKEIQDSIYSQASKNKIAATESQREIDQKNSELEINRLSLSSQRKGIWGLLGGLLLLSVIGFLLYRQGQIRKKNNTVLVHLNRELDDANKLKAKFFGILSHDLRGPIARLVGFLDLQANEPGMFNAEQAARHQKKISRSAQALLESMEAMLLWSKGQMENFKPEVKRLPVDDLFVYIAKSFASVDGVRFNFLNHQNLLINTDENYLQTIMYNLTSNAVKALSEIARAEIEWKAWKENGHIHLSITDNGTGIGSEQVKVLFGESNTTGASSGLGLQIIKELAKAIRCSISIEPVGSGTRFVLSFLENTA